MWSSVRCTTSKTSCCTIPVWLLIATTMSLLVSLGIHITIVPRAGCGGTNYNKNALARHGRRPKKGAKRPFPGSTRRRPAKKTADEIGKWGVLGQRFTPGFELPLDYAQFGKHA